MTPIELQIDQMQSLASRHYPDDQSQRNECLVRLLTERLRAFHAMYAETTSRDYSELRNAGFSWEEISLGSQEVVRT